MRSLKNVDIILNAQTTEVKGDGSKVTGLEYRDRVSGDVHSVALAGIFVQIGLLPNTTWLEGAIERNRMGEIIIDAKCETSVKGVFCGGRLHHRTVQTDYHRDRRRGESLPERLRSSDSHQSIRT
ncbi:Alkyl hydroperoxide reductase subunit F [Leclercia adecarboxylata]|uniref:Alkyl hydroperoxide reductase subunit F n=1 Tax=Leclercia adecarboxylata TaxID=83655 RepID=A0A4U9HNX3_9ENTR|nr:Alkyl hydroperoxide reductase subunit F [Leclercia adecarboxylata]